MTRARSILVLIVFAVASLGTARAPATITGAGVFDCIADLPVWPTFTPTFGTCEGMMPISFFAGVNDKTGTSPWATTGANPLSVPFFAVFYYFETCVGSFPVTGFADGIATIGGLGSGSDSMEVNFSWVRVGNFAWTLTGKMAGANSFSDGNRRMRVGNQDKARDAVGGFTYGTFTPLTPMGTCAPSGARPLKALITGVDLAFA